MFALWGNIQCSLLPRGHDDGRKRKKVRLSLSQKSRGNEIQSLLSPEVLLVSQTEALKKHDSIMMFLRRG